MKLKKMLVGLCTLTMMFATNTLSFAEPISDIKLDVSEFQSSLTDEDLAAANPEFISFSDYLDKYGEENVIEGFNIAEVGNKSGIYGIVDKDTLIANGDLKSEQLNEPNSLYTSLSEGKFLGMDVTGVSDLPPNDTRFSVTLNNENYVSAPNLSSYNFSDNISSEINNKANDSIMSSTTKHNQTFTDPTTNVPYRLYWYGDTTPDHSWIRSNLCSTTHGSFSYKYSYKNSYGYACTSTIDFTSATLKAGSELTNMYAYIAAQGSYKTLDFGFITNPTDRSMGYYGFYNLTDSLIQVDTWPKVMLQWDSDTGIGSYLNGGQIKLMLDVEPTSCYLYMYNSSNSVIYYKQVSDTSGHLVPASSNLSFIQAMSCVNPGADDSPAIPTSITSGAYFKNVKFRNTKVLRDSSYGGDFTLPTYGSNTQFVYINKYSKLTHSPFTNYDNISINYN